MCMAFTREQSAFPLAGKAHCAMHRVWAREYGLVRTCTDLYGPSFAGGFGGQAAQGYVGAVRSGNSKAQGAEVGKNIPVHSLTHGGKSEVSPRAPCAWRSPENKAHSHRLAEHIVQCTGWEQRTHEYCEYREYCKWSMAACVPCALEFR